MGVFRQKVTIINLIDKALVKRSIIKPEEMRQMDVDFFSGYGSIHALYKRKDSTPVRFGNN